MHLKVYVDAGSPVIFVLFHRRLALPNGAKKRHCSHRSSDPYSSMHWSLSILVIPPSLRDVINTADGLQHVHFSDRIRGGSFRLWTGDDGYEEAGSYSNSAGSSGSLIDIFLFRSSTCHCCATSLVWKWCARLEFLQFH